MPIWGPLLQSLEVSRFRGATAHQQYRDVHRDTSSEVTLARGLAGSGRQEEELFLSAVSFLWPRERGASYGLKGKIEVAANDHGRKPK
jgi:hypothetical protein